MKSKTLEELELIDSYIEDNPPKGNNEAIFYLGESIKKLAQADVFVGICESYEWSGCRIENITAESYGIKSYSKQFTITLNTNQILYVKAPFLQKREKSC